MIKISQITPGPWTLRKLEGIPYRDGPVYCLDGNTPDKYKGMDGRIATLHMAESHGCDWTFPKDKDGEMTYDEDGILISYNRAFIDAEANARLIAAAPDMFRLLEGFANCGAEDIKVFLSGIINPIVEIKTCESADYEIY